MTQSTLYVGLDNGTSGALALLYPDGRAHALPTPAMEWGPDKVIDDLVLRKLILGALAESPEGTRLTVAFERSQKNPVWGAVTNFLQGDGGAVFRTMARQNGWRAKAVNPKDWQSVIFQYVPDVEGDTKAKSVAYAQRNFPEVSLLTKPKSKKPHDGMADALCIAAWARLHHL